MSKFVNRIYNSIADAAPANKWPHFKKKACCGKGGKTTNYTYIAKKETE